ncbi:hypothetical protein PPERSA_00746 [Pseudocohnilembus persalinus]|uniref:Transmembrane protein n=1 Tax=Pseudocohnilembus persalinus TaxID=266149 RepID=A0A0V0R4R0_PSEPJ|nr:hypothetical protein PPERSA_00746 [Pseudocohnilembus persalinus]|eukprot:KRX09467.1 hypothetical protein PPERSA_00746 [Pseudocohnilembus persalinus]
MCFLTNQNEATTQTYLINFWCALMPFLVCILYIGIICYRIIKLSKNKDLNLNDNFKWFVRGLAAYPLILFICWFWLIFRRFFAVFEIPIPQGINVLDYSIASLQVQIRQDSIIESDQSISIYMPHDESSFFIDARQEKKSINFGEKIGYKQKKYSEDQNQEIYIETDYGQNSKDNKQQSPCQFQQNLNDYENRKQNKFQVNPSKFIQEEESALLTSHVEDIDNSLLDQYHNSKVSQSENIQQLSSRCSSDQLQLINDTVINNDQNNLFPSEFQESQNHDLNS